MKTVWITGTTRGLGHELAKTLSGQGYHVVCIDRKRAGFSGKNLEHFQLDLARAFERRGEVEGHFADWSARELESAVLVNNAAASSPIGLLPNLDPAEVEASLLTNLHAPMLLSMAFLRAFRATRCRKRLIQVSSGAAIHAIAGSNVYCVAKAGLEMFARGLHSEAQFCETPFESIAFRPGVMDTEMQTAMRSYGQDVLPTVAMYKGFHEKGLLRSPRAVAEKLHSKLIAPGQVEPGRVYSIDEL